MVGNRLDFVKPLYINSNAKHPVESAVRHVEEIQLFPYCYLETLQTLEQLILFIPIW